MGLIKRPKTVAELDDRANEILEEIEVDRIFAKLDDIDVQMKNHPECNDKFFYQKCQDKINLLYNKLRVYYYDLEACLETYISCRSFALLAEYELNKKEKFIVVAGKKMTLSRAPGRDTLRDACITEIPDMNYALILIKGQKNRADSALKTSRNHTYGADDSQDKTDDRD